MKWIVVALAIWAAWTYLRPKKPRITRATGDEREARAILGLEPAASAAEVRAAHRRLVANVHPDRGGSVELARRVNWARDVLLGAKGPANGSADGSGRD